MSARVRNGHAKGAGQQGLDGVRVVGLRRCSRGALLGGTALRAAALVVLAAPAHAQLAATAHPMGGQVTGGSASIQQKGNTTDIVQRTGRAAIDWQSFNVGSNARVAFSQPNSKSVVLNTVVGPNPSEIAGRITANGVVAVVNQSGVIFDRGSQVDTAGLIVSAAGITRQNFMAGHMVFDQAPHPGAAVVNDGTITIRQAGLAALVAPQVINNGLIQAKLGRVVLGGASTYTLDLYGDGLLALNVTGQVTNVTVGGRTMPALVTNAGTILADGGSVMLNASAADGLIQTLVEAGGTIAARSVGTLAGRVLVQGVGGSVDIAGAVSATGVAAGTHGGTIVANATGTVSVASGARIDASGNAGGGLVAIGTTASRARSPKAAASLTAQAADVADGARITANAVARGQGGQVTVLSSGATSLGGVITVLGGAAAGNGGQIEVSGEQVSFTGLTDGRAPQGRIGGLLIDPLGLVISDTKPTAGKLGGASYISPVTLEAQTTNVTLTSGVGDIDFAISDGKPNTLILGSRGLTITSAGTVNFDSGFSISAGVVTLSASGGVAFDTATGVSLGIATVASTTPAFLSGSTISLNAGLGDVDLAAAAITAGTSLALNSTAGSVSGSGVLTAPLLTASAATGIALTGSNAIGTAGVLSTTGGFIALADAGNLVLNGAVSAGALAGDISIGAAGTLTIQSKITAGLTGTILLTSSSGDIVETGAAAGLVGGTLTGSAVHGAATLTGANNDVSEVGSFTAGGALDLANGANNVHVAADLTAGGGLTLTAGGLTPNIVIDAAAAVDASGTILLEANNFAISGSVSTTGLIAINRATSGGFLLSGVADSFAGNGLSGLSAGTIALGSVDGLTNNTLTTSLTLAENLGSSALTLGLFAGGAITQTAGALVAATIEGVAKGDVSLALAGNSFADVGPLSSTAGSIKLADAHALTTIGTLSAQQGLTVSVTGSVGAVQNTLSIANNVIGAAVTLSAPGTITQSAGTIDAISGAVSLTSQQDLVFESTVQASGLVSLIAAGSISDDADAGRISAGSLFGTAAAGNIVIENGTNSFATLTGLTASGNVTLRDGSGFQAAGNIAGGVVSLVAAGTITQTAGSLTATALSGSAQSAVSLAHAGNSVGTLSGFTSNGFTLAQAGTLDLTGTLRAGSEASLSTGATALTIATGGSVTATTISVTAGSLNASGALSAGLLTGTVTGSAMLTGSNSITSVGAFSASSITLDDTVGLTIAGNLVGTNGIILNDTGSIGQTGGGITATSLTGSAGASVSLTSATNSIADLGSFTSVGGFALWDSPSVTVTDSVSNTGGGALLLHAKTVVVEAAPGALTNIGGTISLAADTLTLAGNVSTGAHEGLVGITLIDMGTLTIAAGDLPTVTTGTLSIGSLDGVTASGSVTGIVLNSAPTGPDTLAVFTSGNLKAAGGISVGTLTGSVGTAAFAGTDTINTLRDFAVTGGGLTFRDSNGLTLAGSIDVAGAADFIAAGDLTERVGGAYSGALTATALSGSASGLIDLGNGANAIGSAGGLTATAGPLTLADGMTLSVNGILFSGGVMRVAVTGGSNSLSLTAAGALNATDALSLSAAGGIGEAAGASLTATTLTASAGGSLSLTGSNAFGTLGSTQGGAIAIDDTLALTIAGDAAISGTSISIASQQALTQLAGTVAGAGTMTATAGSISLTGGGTGVAFGGTLAASQGVQFAALTGSVVENDGTTEGGIAAASVGGTAKSFILDGTNSLGSISGLDATAGDATIFATPRSGSATVTVAGNVAASGTLAIGLTGAGAVLDLTGALSGGSVGLSAGGGIAQTAGSITAGTLSADSSSGAVSITSTANAVQALGLSSGQTGFAFTDGSAAGTLTVSGPVSVGSLSTLALTSAGLAVDAGLTATGGEILLSTDALSISGSVSTGAGTGLVAVDTDLDSTLTIDGGNFSHVTTGELALGSTDGTTASGKVATITIASAIDLSSGAPTLGLFTTVPGTVNGTGGIKVDTLIGNAGDVSLTGANAVGTLAGFTATSFTLMQDGALAVAGPLTAPVVTLSAGSLTIPGTITAVTSLSLTATSGGIAESGSITTGLLGGSSAGSIMLTGTTPASNSITAVAGLSGEGVLLDDGRNLAVTGLLASGTGTTVFGVAGSIDASAGTLTGAGVSGSATGSAVLTGTSNDFAALTDFSAASIAARDGAASLTLSGVNGTTSVSIDAPNAAMSVAGLVTGSLTSLTAASIDIAAGGTIDASSQLTLSTAGPISEAGGITAGTLTGTSGTAAALLDGTGNSIKLLGDFSAGSFTLVQTSALAVGGTLTSTVATLSAGTLTIPGTIDATSSLDLISGSTIGETGTIGAGTLRGSAVGDASLTGTNSIGTLGALSAATLELDDATSLDVVGSVTGTTSANITLTGTGAGAGTLTVDAAGSLAGSVTVLKAAEIDVLGVIDAATSLDLITSGSVTEPASGSITTSVLSADVGGTLSLTGAANVIGSLGDITTPDGFTYSQAGSLTIAGTISGGSFATITSGDLLTIAGTGSITAVTTSLAGSAIAIAGTVTGTSLTSLTATAGNVTEIAASMGGTVNGAVNTGTLTGSATGDATLLGANSITTLGVFGATDFDLLDAGAPMLTVGGVQTVAANFTLDAPSITIGTTINAAAVSLTTTAGTLSETAAGGIDAASLSGSVSAGAALGGANLIGTLNNFAATSFLLQDGQALDVAGSLTAATITLAALALQIDGFVDATGVAGLLTLTAQGDATPGDGTIDESATGSIAAATLTGSAQGSASLVGVNTITILQSFAAAPLTLNDSTGLTIASGATVSGSYTPAGGAAVTGPVSLAIGGTLAIAGTLDATGEGLDITAAAITETGSVLADTLTGKTTGATSLNMASNAIATVGSFTAAGFSLVDKVKTLEITGPLQGGASVSVSNHGTTHATGELLVSGSIGGTAVTLHADQLLSITGTVRAPASLALSAGTTANTGTLNETGSIVAGSLTGNVQGVADLSGDGFNSITVLGSFTATGGLTLVDDAALSIVGPIVSGPFLNISTTSSLTIGDTTGGKIAFGGSFITIDGTIDATTSLALTASGVRSHGVFTPGTIIEAAGGVLKTPLLTGSAGGDVDLSRPGVNLVGTIGTFATGGLMFADSEDLAVVGPLTSSAGATLTDAGHGISVSGSISAVDVSLAAGDLTIPGSIDGSASITLSALAAGSATGTILETGALVTPVLSGSATGSASLLSAADANDIDTLDSFQAAGFALNDSVALTTSGTVSGGSTLSISAAALTLAGMVDASSVSLFANTGSLSEMGSGAISATSLNGSASAAVVLGGANSLTTLGSFTADGFALNDLAALTIAGPLAGGPSVDLTATALTISGTLTAAALALSIGGTLSETGSIAVTSLTGSIDGAASFVGSNSIGTLGDFSASGLVLDDSTGLQVAGTLTSPTATLNAASLGITGVIDAGDLVLISAGTISESGTLLVSGTLTGSAAGTATLIDPGFSNQIANLGSFSAAGFALNDGAALTVAGPLDGHASVVIDDSLGLTITGALNGDLTTLTAADLTIPGMITAATSLSLSVSGTIAEPGSISTALLTGASGGSASFSGSNSITSAGPFVAASFALNDAADLSVTGPIDGGAAVTITGAGALSVASSITGSVTSLTAATIDVPGSIDAVSLALSSTAGAITESGSIAAGTLTGAAATSASLTGTNSIAILGDFTATTGFALNDIASLTVAGTLAGGPSVTIADTHDLAVAGSVTGDTTALTAAAIDTPGSITAATALALDATAGSITSGGSLTTAVLSGNATGSVALTGTNRIAAVSNFFASSFSLLRDAVALAVTGIIEAGGPVTISDTAAIEVADKIDGNVVSLTATSIDVATFGRIDAPAELQIDAFAGNFTSNGVIDTALLDGSATGFVSLTNEQITIDGETRPAEANVISTIGSFTSNGFFLTTAGDLAVSGPLEGGSGVSLNAGGTLTIAGSLAGSVTALNGVSIDIPGSIAAGTSLALATGFGPITESGSITTPLLTVNAVYNDTPPTGAAATLTGVNMIGSLGAVTANGFTLDNLVALTVAGTVNGQSSIVINEAAELTVLGGAAINGDATTLNAAALTVTGQITAGTALTVGIGGSIGETGVIATAMLTGHAGGAVQLGGANQIAGVGDFLSGGNFALQDVTDLAFSGALNATAGNVTVRANNITEADVASIVTGVPGASATTGTITLGSPGQITIDGMMDAPTILVGTSTGTAGNGGVNTGAPTLVTWNGNSIITGASGVPGASQPMFPSIFGTTPGIYVLATNFKQTGSTVVNANGKPGTIEITLARHTGSVLFDQTQGLDAPHSELFINLDLGFASGRIDVAGLNISYVEPGSNMPSNLFGVVDNEQGPTASGAAFIKVLPDSNYRLNSCPIQSVNCILVSPIIVPVTDPVDDVEVTTPRRRRDDDDLIIPNVGEQDF